MSDATQAVFSRRFAARVRGGVSAITVVAVGVACSVPSAPVTAYAPIAGGVGDPAPVLLLPHASGERDWQPAETRAGDLNELVRAIRGAPLWVHAEGVAGGGLREGLAPHVAAAEVVPSAEPLEQLRKRLPEGGRLLWIEPAPREREGREAHVYGSCEPVRRRLGQAQEEGLVRLEPFLDTLDTELGRAWSAGLAEREGQLESLASASCGPAISEHVTALKRCARSGATCEWSPRVFLQGRARIGRAAEAPRLDLDQGACAEPYRALLAQVDAEALKVLPRAASRWSELAARVASLGAIDAAIEDGCAPRRRRYSDIALAGLHARVAGIEELLARERASPAGGPDWVESIPDADGEWRAVDAEFHVPGLGPVRELAHYRGAPVSSSEQILAGVGELEAALTTAAQCVGRPGEAPLAWRVFDREGEGPLAEGEVFAETLVCGDLGLRP